MAVSFLDELARMRGDDLARAEYPWIGEVDVVVSPSVEQSLAEATSAELRPGVEQSRPWHARRWAPVRRRYDVSFSVFGPEYAARRATRRIVGFADVRSIHGVPLGEPTGLGGRLRWRLRGVVSRRVVKRSDLVVVETSALRDSMRSRGFRNHDIRVVPNTISAVFAEARTAATHSLPTGGELVLAYVARPYPHKNFGFLTELARFAREDHGVRVSYLLTASEAEADEAAPGLAALAECVGVVPVRDLPNLYEKCDAVLFPSLLEAFSATPLEAMASGRPVFASDRDFVRAVCGDVPYYIDPLDARTSAHVIAQAMGDPMAVARKVEAGRTLVDGIPSAQARARAYCALISEQLKVQHG